MSLSPFTRHKILFEDSEIIAIEKPDGVLSHPNSNGQKNTCSFNGQYDPQNRIFKTSGGNLWLLHRLDQDTSGVLLAAKSKQGATFIRKFFENRKITKKYIALVTRKIMPQTGVWRDLLIEKRERGTVRAFAAQNGKPNAFLNYKLKKFFFRSNLSLVEFNLLTGKTHQIRVQASSRGHFVAGDRVYGNFSLNKLWKQTMSLKRLFLHSYFLSFPHPKNGKTVEINCPIPATLEETLSKLL